MLVLETALEAARKVFPHEFLNRFDATLVYAGLEQAHLEQIFDKFLSAIHERTVRQAGVPLLIKVTEEAKRFIIERGTDPRFGARPLRRAMESELVNPLSRLIAAKSLRPGDVVEVELDDGDLTFFRGSRASTAVVA